MLSPLTRLPRLAKLVIVLGVDIAIGAFAFWAAIAARAGSVRAFGMREMLLAAIAIAIVVPSAGFLCGLYRPAIRYAIPKLALRAAAVGLVSGASIAVLALLGGASPPRSFGLGTVFALMLFPLLVLSRHAARWVLHRPPTIERIRTAVYGAGAAGRQVVALMRDAGDCVPVVFLDDDASLHGRMVEGVEVLNPRDPRLRERLESRRVQQVFLAIPSLKPGRRREVLEKLAELGYRVRTVPGLAEVIRGEREGMGALRDVSIEDLLGRDPVSPLPGLLNKCIAGKTVFVTGGGGSIGAELCRQVLAQGPKRLIVLDHSEFALYQIEQELRAVAAHPPGNAMLEFILGSVTDRITIAGIFARYPVDTVYHAAAYKHVPIVEANPLEGLRNNALGTWYVAQAAAKAQVRHFILVSSDKAVRPANVMGATKRMAELVVQMLAERSTATCFSMVRFGNVLESSGSVVPLFRRQIESGGPLTLTHAEVTRYFMTIQEAVQLVIQAGAMARGGEVFVLDMGSPVKIRDLATRMIRLSGHSVRDDENPHGDIAIQIVGLRPGEKLYEELLIGGESIGTEHPRISRVREAAAEAVAFENELLGLEVAFQSVTMHVNVGDILCRWVSGYCAPSAARLSRSVPGPSATNAPVATSSAL